MHWHITLFKSIAWASVAAAINTSCIGINAVSPSCKTAQTPYYRDVFFISGKYIPYGTTYIISNQLYVEKLTPIDGVVKPYPLVFISAGVPSGSVWLNTPDNRKGWSSYFLDEGYQVYIIDITGNGRSSQNDVDGYPLTLGSTVSIHQNDYTAPELIDPYPQSQGHDKWPGNGTKGDAIFDAFFAATLPLTSNKTAQELSQISKVPYVIFTAANLPHITYDHCMISYLAQAGVKDVTWVKFGDLDLVGNAHFFYLEENSPELAAVVAEEIAKRN